MDLNYLDKLPERRRGSARFNNKIQQKIYEFYNSDRDYAEVTFNYGEYNSSASLMSSLQKAIPKLDLPVEALMIDGGVYLRRTD